MIYDNLIVGGGFFGLYLANYLSQRGESVIVLEKDAQLMQRASLHNQARVHNGYHYPRSVLTALRSRVSFPRFSSDFSNCIDSSFDKYYAIGKILGKITAKQFYHFCLSIGAPCYSAPGKIKSLFNSHYVEEVFSTVEYAFDSTALKETILKRLSSTNTMLETSTKVVSLDYRPAQKAILVQAQRWFEGRTEGREILAKQVFNCAYSSINQLVQAANLELIPLKHELTEICLVEVPEELRDKGVTIMCGPFFSLMPFPSRRLHSFSHVRYTPHFSWQDDPQRYQEPHQILEQYKRKSAFKHMASDAKRYMPLIASCKNLDSLWEVKTVLPRSENDDSRPILFRANYKIPGFHCILGGKIDNVYDMISALEDSHYQFKN